MPNEDVKLPEPDELKEVVEGKLDEQLENEAPKGHAGIQRRLPNGLLEQEEAFARHYVVTMDAKKAVLEAGYKVSSDDAHRSLASRLMSRPAVQKRIADLRRMAQIRTDVTTDVIVEMLQKTYLAAMEDKKYDSANKAAELLGKYLGMFNETVTRRPATPADKDPKEFLQEQAEKYAKAAGLNLSKESGNA